MTTVPENPTPSHAPDPQAVMNIHGQMALAAVNFVSGYVAGNPMGPDEALEFIRKAYRTILELPNSLVSGAPSEGQDAAASARRIAGVIPARKSPEVIAESLKPEGIISFIDGKMYKVLTRHLNRHGLTAEAYREAFGLPLDYPMVTPAYSAERAELARTSGLGKSRKASGGQPAAPQAPVAPTPLPAPTPAAAPAPTPVPAAPAPAPAAPVETPAPTQAPAIRATPEDRQDVTPPVSDADWQNAAPAAPRPTGATTFGVDLQPIPQTA